MSLNDTWTTRETHPLVALLTDVRREHQHDGGVVAATAGFRRFRLTQYEAAVSYPTVAKLQRWAAALGYEVAVRVDDGRIVSGHPVEVLTGYRKWLDWSQEKVALASKEPTFSQSQLAGWERSRNIPGLWSLTRWAQALGCELVLVAAADERRVAA